MRRALALLLLAVIVKGAVWAVTIPPFDGPDEPDHFAYAQMLALRGELPRRDQGSRVGRDVQTLMRGALVPIDPGIPTAHFYPERAPAGQVGATEPQADRSPADAAPGTAGQYGPVTYLLFAAGIKLAGGGIVSQVLAARLVAVMLGAVGVLGTVWAAWEARLGRGLALAAGAIVGFQPMWSQQTAVVTADAGVLAAAAVFLALILRWRRRPGVGVGVACVAVLSAGLLSKPAMLFAVPFLLVLGAGALARGGVGSRLKAAAPAAAALAVSMAAYLLWTSRRSGFVDTSGRPGRLSDYVKLLLAGHGAYVRRIEDSFWGVFGWLEAPLPSRLLLLLAVVAVAWAALAVFELLRGRSLDRATATLLWLYLLALVGSLVAFDVGNWRARGAPALQGRYLLPALPALVVLVVAGLRDLLPARLHWFLPGALTALAVVLNLIALETLWAYYLVT